MRKICFALLIFALLLFLCTGCTSQKGTLTQDQDNSKKIGMIVSTLNNPFFIALKAGAEAEAVALGYDLILLDSQNDLEKEAINMEALVKMGVDIVLINPCDAQLSSDTVKVANKAGIPVITLDRATDTGEVVCHIASDNVQGGVIAADFMNHKLSGTGNIVVLEGIKGTSAAIDRSKGFIEGLSAYPELKILHSESASFDRAMGLSVMEEILKNYSDIQAVFAQNDEMALGAIQAISARGNNILVVGFDGIPDAIIAVNEGEMAATIAQQPDQIGVLGIKGADQYLKGQPINQSILVDLKLIEKKQ